MNSRETTDYLRACAIWIVLVNHLINGYTECSLKGYANGFISIFFLLSGYGIFHSLKRHLEKDKLNFFLAFYKNRCLRIYPLLWIWCAMHNFPGGFMGVLALNFINPKTPWFIPAIMQCYLVSPFLFLISERLSARKGILIVISIFIIINFLAFKSGFVPVRAIGYKGIFFLHVLIFYFGIILAKIEGKMIVSGKYKYLFLAMFLLSVQENTPQSIFVFKGENFIFPIMLVFGVFAFCYSMLSNKNKLPFKKWINFVGRHTLPIYLFGANISYILLKIGVLESKKISLIGLVAWFFLAAIFIVVAGYFEEILNKIVFSRKLKERSI